MADPAGKKPAENEKGKGITRRQFVAGTGVAVVVGGVAGGVLGSTVLSGGKTTSAPASFTELGGQKHVKGLLGTVPESSAYLVVDSLKCCWLPELYDGLLDGARGRFRYFLVQDPSCPERVRCVPGRSQGVSVPAVYRAGLRSELPHGRVSY